MSFEHQTGNAAVSVVNVVYEGSDKLGVDSMNGQGTYDVIGHQKEDLSAIYAQSQSDWEKHESGNRPLILIDWQNSKNWIGTVIISFALYVLIVLLAYYPVLC